MPNFISLLDQRVTISDAWHRFEFKADWHWDITRLLLELRVAIYDPADDTLIAHVQCLQTSLVRKSNEIVARWALAILFDDPVPCTGAQ